MTKPDTSLIGRLFPRLRLYATAPQLLEALKEARTALYEVKHAQAVGSNWFTKGERGLHDHVRASIDRGVKAANMAIKAAEKDPYDD